MPVKPLLEQLSERVGQAFVESGFPAERGRVVLSSRPELGQFQCNGAMACAKEARRNPMDIAEAIAGILQAENSLFARVEAARPGFLNLDITDTFLSRHAQEMADDAALGGYVAPEPKTVLIDYCGPNIAKPMHVGHLRSSVIGNSLYRLFRNTGHKVISDIHLGDWGLPMGMLISEIRRQQPDLPYFEEGRKEGFPTEPPVTLEQLETMYPQVSALCKEDAARLEEARAAVQALQDGHPGYRALWRHFVGVSVNKVKENLALLDVDFDLWLGESDTQSLIPGMIEELKAVGIAEESEGALVIRVEEGTDNKTVPPMLLLKSDGAALYSTTDLATIKQRMQDYQPNIILYLADQRQHLHFEQVFRAARKAGYVKDTVLEHIGFGTVNGKDGKPFKTRDGGAMKLRDLIQLCIDAVQLKEGGHDTALAEAIGIAALKFADLSSQRIAGYAFDVERFVSTEGRTGPYLQYACVRVHSMMQKSDVQPGNIHIAEPEEKALALIASRFPNAMQEALQAREPSVMCEYAYELAQAFSRFYAACPIARAEDRQVAASRMGLAKLVHGQIAACLDILGIKVPERM